MRSRKRAEPLFGATKLSVTVEEITSLCQLALVDNVLGLPRAYP